MRSSANRRSRLASRSWSMRSRTLGRASDAVIGSPSLVRAVIFIARDMSLPRRSPILFGATREQALHLCNAPPRFDISSASNGLQAGGAYLSRPEECTLLIELKPAEVRGRRWGNG